MQTKLMRSPAVRSLLAMSLLFVAISGATAHASNDCAFSGQGNSFQAFRVYGGGLVDASVAGAFENGLSVGGEHDYYGSKGFVIFNSTGKLEAYYLHLTGGAKPTVIVSNGSQTVIKESAFGSGGTLLTAAHERWAAVQSGTHYVVAFSFGSHTYSGHVSIGLAECVPLSPPSTLIQKDQTDFLATSGSLPGSGQVYVPGAGVGNNLKLSVDNPRRFFVGYLSEYIAVGSGRLTFATPGLGVQTANGTTQQSQSGTLAAQSDRLAVWTTGTASFTLNYNGLLPETHVDGWLLDL